MCPTEKSTAVLKGRGILLIKKCRFKYKTKKVIDDHIFFTIRNALTPTSKTEVL